MVTLFTEYPDGAIIRFKRNPYQLVTMREFELTNEANKTHISPADT